MKDQTVLACLAFLPGAASAATSSTPVSEKAAPVLTPGPDSEMNKLKRRLEQQQNEIRNLKANKGKGNAPPFRLPPLSSPRTVAKHRSSSPLAVMGRMHSKGCVPLCRAPFGGPRLEPQLAASRRGWLCCLAPGSPACAPPDGTACVCVSG